MGMEKKYLHGMLRESRGIISHGEFVPHITKKGGLIVLGGVTAFAIAKEGFKSRNQQKLGRISYADGPARMTGSFTSGAIPAMNRASGGNPAARNAMFMETMNTGPGGSSPLQKIENYGVDGQFISSLYNMGG